MDIKTLEDILIKHKIFISAIPLKENHILEAYHIDKYPQGTISYLEKYKREMLQYETIPKNAGKFTIDTQNSILFGTKKRKYYDTIEDAINDWLSEYD